MERCGKLGNTPPPPPKKIYLACPYSAKRADGSMNEKVCRDRFLAVNKVAGFLMKMGMIVFSPISHSVPIADEIGDHLNHDFWLKQDFAFINWCDELWVYKIPGWEQSVGVGREIECAKRLCKPVRYLELEEYEDGKPKESLGADLSRLGVVHLPVVGAG